MLVLGVDPGLHGALALYDSESRSILSITDMPIWIQPVGGKKREQLDELALMSLFRDYAMLGVSLAVIEKVGGIPGQSAPAAFNFGIAVSPLIMCCRYEGIPFERPTPQTWKPAMRVPGKRGSAALGAKDATQEIIAVADRMFPNDTSRWRGPRGGFMADRAEAAMLARYGAEHLT
ncbi:hypothetical protein UFOVP1299_5 [uncultured Caudovirales phage]|uniref:Uncharacterized protein n=1 Tax=uncultured Caudovirales phage TaxID=2100421 RepID=A0A6J5RSJ8_9CAUD|nr:hypothetical protein UFOVP1299_5 [uncultured Caudovirales phage]